MRFDNAETVVSEILWAAWQPVIATAGATAGPAHIKLVDLLTEIRAQGVLRRDQRGRECVVWGLKAHVDLPVFGAQMREAWDIADTPSDRRNTWTNLNGFAARPTRAGIDFALYAIWTLRECLEESVPCPDKLPAVVQWFRYSGPTLASFTLQRRSFRENGPAARVGPLCEENGIKEAGFTIERWEYWRSRLEVLAAGADTAARAAAHEALNYLGECDAQR
jgi:Protein of unknown function (DUF3632)